MMRGMVNALRWRAVRSSRAWKAIIFDGAIMKRSAAHALADLRDFCHAGHGARTFNKDPLEMARRTGRREVFERITAFLNLDEDQVQKLMEIDDGL